MITNMRNAFSFRLGILMMIFAAVIRDDRIHSLTLAMLPLFFFAGLLATSLARLSSLYISRSVQRTTFSGRWFVLNTGAAALVDGMGLLLALLLAGLSLGGISSLVQQLLAGIGTVFLAIMYPILVVIDAVATWLGEHLSAAWNYLQAHPIGNTFNKPQTSSAQANQAAIAGILTSMIKVVLIALVIIVAILVLARLWKRREREKGDNSEEREHLDSQNLLNSVGAALRNALSGLQAALPLDWLTGRHLL